MTEPANRWWAWYAKVVPAWIRRFLPERRVQTGWRGLRRGGFVGVDLWPRLWLSHASAARELKMRRLLGSFSNNGPGGSSEERGRSMSALHELTQEIQRRQANPLNTCCVRCQGLIYPRSSHVCPVLMRERAREARGTA